MFLSFKINRDNASVWKLVPQHGALSAHSLDTLHRVVGLSHLLLIPFESHWTVQNALHHHHGIQPESSWLSLMTDWLGPSYGASKNVTAIASPLFKRSLRWGRWERLDRTSVRRVAKVLQCYWEVRWWRRRPPSRSKGVEGYRCSPRSRLCTPTQN